MEMPRGEYIWWNGKVVKEAEAKISLFSHVIHYGTGIFEGIRAYEQHSGKGGVFRLKEHMDRLAESCKILQFKMPYSVDTLMEATSEVCKANSFKECYIRPVLFIGDGPLGVNPGNAPPIHAAILTWKWGSYLNLHGRAAGSRVRISSFQRPHVNTLMSKAKVSGHYINSVLAKREALETGFDEALLLDTEGYLSEGTGMNLFLIKGKKIKTTPLTSILNGITRQTIIQVLMDNGYEVLEERFTRDELYCADEVFLTGTAAEISPVIQIDHRSIGWGEAEGSVGKVTLWLQDYFKDLVRGKYKQYQQWIHPIA